MKKFTVVGFYEDNGQILVHHVEAMNPNHAVRVAIKDLEKSGSSRDNICIVEIFPDHITGSSDTADNTVSCAADWPDGGDCPDCGTHENSRRGTC